MIPTNMQTQYHGFKTLFRPTIITPAFRILSKLHCLFLVTLPRRSQQIVRSVGYVNLVFKPVPWIPTASP
jgi:hypothetical protein